MPFATTTTITTTTATTTTATIITTATTTTSTRSFPYNCSSPTHVGKTHQKRQNALTHI